MIKKSIKLGSKYVGDNFPVIISFEASSTYSDLQTAKTMVKAAASSGADAIKFQTVFRGEADRFLEKKDLKIDFSTPTGKKEEFMIDAIRRRELSHDEWRELASYAKSLGLIFISSPYYYDGVEFLQEIQTDALKLSKGDVDNVFLIEEMAKTKIPILIDGREKFEDVEKAIKICESNGNDQIILMHCPSGYPAENAGVHLSAITEIKNRYPYHVGFADHSLGGLMNYVAVGLGAKLIEKTITPDKTTELSEHYMSLEFDELKPFVENIRAVENAIGNPSILQSSRVSQDVRRCFISKSDISKGQKISKDVLDFKRPGNIGISVSQGKEIIKKIAKIDISKDTFIQWDMLE